MLLMKSFKRQNDASAVENKTIVCLVNGAAVSMHFESQYVVGAHFSPLAASHLSLLVIGARYQLAVVPKRADFPALLDQGKA